MEAQDRRFPNDTYRMDEESEPSPLPYSLWAGKVSREPAHRHSELRMLRNTRLAAAIFGLSQFPATATFPKQVPYSGRKIATLPPA